MSDSKLNLLQKQFRKQMKQDNPKIELHSFPEFNCVVGIRRTSETVAEFAISICAAGETKFRRKVGEYHVLSRFVNYCTQPAIHFGRDIELRYFARDIAQLLGRHTC